MYMDKKIVLGVVFLSVVAFGNVCLKPNLTNEFYYVKDSEDIITPDQICSIYDKKIYDGESYYECDSGKVLDGEKEIKLHKEKLNKNKLDFSYHRKKWYILTSKLNGFSYINSVDIIETCVKSYKKNLKGK